MRFFCSTLEIVNTITNISIALIALLALIFGSIYINKKLMIYIFEENGRIVIKYVDKGNEGCYIDKIFCTTNSQTTSLVYNFDSLSKNISIDINIIPSTKKIHFELIDNFGRLYKKTYKNKKGKKL